MKCVGLMFRMNDADGRTSPSMIASGRLTRTDLILVILVLPPWCKLLVKALVLLVE